MSLVLIKSAFLVGLLPILFVLFYFSYNIIGSNINIISILTLEVLVYFLILYVLTTLLSFTYFFLVSILKYAYLGLQALLFLAFIIAMIFAVYSYIIAVAVGTNIFLSGFVSFGIGIVALLIAFLLLWVAHALILLIKNKSSKKS